MNTAALIEAICPEGFNAAVAGDSLQIMPDGTIRLRPLEEPEHENSEQPR
jgi:hypothetical protein